ncbi:glycosyltransferase [Mesorhizobium sp. BE184]|uniref:glycosyltransferase n=1 Tax=Mesorhizobium sp. BE184 TaxID=2817714 RepID=UPI00285BA025|nr:glycosyltransferase [Mesorhizobium sp. BE184]MDR7032378.1 vancomycin aglycone glucosyltransferase [Mesorhizobium sp. BE184]
MRVLLSTYGSRGDTEPLAGLGVALQALGVEAVVSAPPDDEFVDLLARAGVPLAPAFTSVRTWIKDKAKPSAPADFNQLATEMIAGQYEAVGAAAEGCDAILATGLMPSAAAAQCVAEKMGVPYFHASFCPLFLPSHHHRPYRYPGDPLPPEVNDPRALWDLNASAMNARFSGAVNAHRAAIGLPEIDNVRDHVFTDRPLLASDPVLWPWQPTDLCAAIQTGAWVLRDERPLPADLDAFLEKDSPPVYVGFGSIALPTTRDAAHTAIQAVRAQGHRAVVARGWANAALLDDGDDCFLVGEVNQQALFRRVAAIIHHGGAGTTTTATRSGNPQVIVPQIVDQPYWATQVAALGVGVAHDGAVPTLESLSAALAKALAPRTRARASAVALTMNADGAKTAAKLLFERIAREPAEAV